MIAPGEPLDRRARWPARAVLCIAILAFCVKLALAWTTYGTNDIAAWTKFTWVVRTYGGARLYERDPFFNHPPFIVHALQGIGWLAERDWLPFQFWMRLPAILADFGSLLVVQRIYARRSDGPARDLDLGLLAAAPISIFVSGFHGNTDPVMVFFLLLTVLWIDVPGRTWLAGAAFAMSVNIKAVPLMFAPAVFLYLGSARRRAVFVAVAVTVVLAASMPVLAEHPVLVVQRVLGYGSQFGNWGLSRLATQLPAGLGLAYALKSYGIPCLLLTLIGFSLWMNLGGARASLYRQFGLIAFAFLTFCPGFGIQYVAWLVPWIVGLRASAAVVFHLANGVFLFCVYTYWSRGFPWDFANSEVVGVWKGSLIRVEYAAWGSVVLVFVLLVRAVAAEKAARAV